MLNKIKVTGMLLICLYFTTSLSAQTWTTDIQNLITEINSMDLNSGIINSWESKLETVLNAVYNKSLIADNEQTYSQMINSLDALLNALKSKEGKILAAEEYSFLVAEINRIWGKVKYYNRDCPICGGYICVPPCPNA